MTKNKVLILLDGSEFRKKILPHIGRFIRPEENQLILFRVGKPPQPLYPYDDLFYIDLGPAGASEPKPTVMKAF